MGGSRKGKPLVSARPRKELDLSTWPNRVAARMRELAEARNMTPADVSAALAKHGIKANDKAVGPWYTGRNRPPLDAIEALSDIFGYATPAGWLPK